MPLPTIEGEIDIVPDHLHQHVHSVQVAETAKLKLVWTATNAEAVHINPGGSKFPAKGELEIPTKQATYVLTAVAKDGSRSADLTLDVHTHAEGDVVSGHAKVTPPAPAPLVAPAAAEPADQTHFEKLDEGHQAAFLDLKDATTDLQQRYRAIGLIDHRPKAHAKSASVPLHTQRIVRPVVIRAGTRIYKMTGGLEAFEKAGAPVPANEAVKLMQDNVILNPAWPTVTPWWAPVTQFEEDADGVVGHFKDMVFNAASFPDPKIGFSMREYARFMSAVVMEWNKLNYYVEITLAQDVNAYWGQFEPQIGSSVASGEVRQTWGWTTEASEKTAPAIEVEGGARYIKYPNEPKRCYLPEQIGGLGAWQFYIPKFAKAAIDAARMVVIPATDSRALADLFNCPGVFREAEALAAAHKPAPKAAPAKAK